MSKLTRVGARELTQAIDKVAATIQDHPEILGIDPKIAMDYAYRCDLISDAVENKAASNFPLEKDADFDAGAIAEPKGGPQEGDKDEAYMAEFKEDEHHELTDKVEKGQLGKDASEDEEDEEASKKAADVPEDDIAKFASLLDEAEELIAKAAMDDVTVQGYDGFTDQIRALEALTTEVQELDARIAAAVGPLLEEKAGLDKGIKKVHGTIKKEYKDKLKVVGDVTIERKTSLVEARALLQVVARKRTMNQVQKELLGAVAEKYGQEVAEFIVKTQSALRDVNKTMAVAFKGFELEQRAMRTASTKQAGLADLLARFQDLLMKGWRRMVQVVSNAASLVSGQGKQVERAHSEFMAMAKDIRSGKVAASELPADAKVAEDEESSKKAAGTSPYFNLFK